MEKLCTLLLIAGIFSTACNQKSKQLQDKGLKTGPKPSPAVAVARVDSVADDTTIKQRPQVPILCYHRIEN